MEIRRYVMPQILSNMYIISENSSVIIIDPHNSCDAEKFLKEINCSSVDIILTHEHYDHISGIPYFADIAHDIYASKESAEVMAHPELRKENRFSQLFFQAVKSEELNRLHIEKLIVTATKTFDVEYNMNWQGHSIKMVETPGHSIGSICILFDDDKIFTGDSLLPGKITITQFPGGDREKYEIETEPFLRSLSDDVIVYPGHCEITPIGKCWVQ